MTPTLLRLAALLCALALPAGAEPSLSSVTDVEPTFAARPVPRPTNERRCAADGTVCIGERDYAEDVCRAIEEAAGAHGLDVGFFARLLWRESLYDASAVSPAGAQGIAQFMPGTARLRGLRDPFNPAEAILASADYLKDLEREFGSLGLAAVAYNAGEARAEKFLAGNPFLPGETRAYVVAITGHAAEAWLEDAPEVDLALDPSRPFREACVEKATARAIPSFTPPEPELRPWAAIIAGQDSREAAEAQAARVVAEVGVLEGERIDVARQRLPGMPARRHFAQVGRDTRDEAEQLCAQVRAAGGACLVRRN
jgi:hypothetical protein